jgi:3-vinyl bacteriochlorophyllide hydratase
MVFDRLIAGLDCAPWGTVAGRHHRSDAPAQRGEGSAPGRGVRLYTPEERVRRDGTYWTTVQAILAPIQFAVFLTSLVFVLRYLMTGDGWAVATASVVVKTFVLYTIMVTGAFWERAVFGRYLFAPAFFWEDMVSMAVIALHTAYLFALFAGTVDPQRQMVIALAAYAAYLINAAQFVLKLRMARRDEARWGSAVHAVSLAGAAE